MPDSRDTLAQPPSTAEAAWSPGCVVLLIDESAGMEARVADGTKSKAESAATAVNSLLNLLAGAPSVDLAVVGYRGEPDGRTDIGCRWGGPLSDSRFVASNRLADAPLAVENRTRRIPGPGGIAVGREETVRFPIWYAPRLGGPCARQAAWEFCSDLLAAWSPSADAVKPPLVISVFGELSARDDARWGAERIWRCAGPAGPPLVFHSHLGSLARIPPTLYPSSDAHLPPGPIRELFHASSVLPEPLSGALRQAQVAVNVGARGLICNAKVADLIRFLSLVKTYAQYQPPPRPTAAARPAPAAVVDAAPAVSACSPEVPPAAPTGEPCALVVLLVDRSVEDPQAQDNRVWRRLQDQANELLGQMAKRATGAVWCAVVAYGADRSGQPEVLATLSGPLSGRRLARDTELASGALRVEEVTEQISNGIGGLVSVSRKRPVFLELEPAAAMSPLPGFAAVKEILGEWRREQRGNRLAPVVLHLTRGRFEPRQLDEAVGLLQAEGADLPPPLLHHVVLTDSPHRSLAYPAGPERMENAGLQKLWEVSSPLLEGEKLAARRPTISAAARGMVVNAKFDVLLEAIALALDSQTAND